MVINSSGDLTTIKTGSVTAYSLTTAFGLANSKSTRS